MKRNNFSRTPYLNNHSKAFMLMLAAMIFSSLSFAQTTKGLWMTGGNLGLNHYEEQSTFNLTINGGYLFTNHLVTGISFNFQSYSSNYSNTFSNSLNPFVRYYIGSGKTQPFLLASAGYSFFHYKLKNDSRFYYYPESNSDWDFTWNTAAGVSHSLNQNVAIEGIVGYSGKVYINFGFQIFLKQKSE